MVDETTKMTVKTFTNNVLVGMSIGIVVSLVPWALLGNLSRALIPHTPFAATVLMMVTLAIRLLPMAIGVAVAMQFKFSPIQTTSIGIATLIGSGVATLGEGGSFVFSGTGDVINAGLTAAFASLVVLLLGEKLKAYTILLIPVLVILIAGGLGLITLPFVQAATTALGDVIKHVTTLQPVLMGTLLAVIFALLIISPISTVGIAVAVSLSGIGSGAANLGICAAGFGLAIMGWRSNSVATSFAHFLGSPKMQMANFLNRPKIAIPIICNASILGALAGILGISGTPISAGFGFSGLIGPLGAFETMPGGFSNNNALIIIFAFFVLPIVLGLLFKMLFVRVIPLVKDEDYAINFS